MSKIVRKKAGSKGLVKAKPATAWSMSRLNDYRRCPKQFYFKHILRIKEPPNKAMARGTEIHEMAEAYVLGKLKDLPPVLSAFADEFAELRKMKPKPVTEEMLCYDADWNPTASDDWDGIRTRIKADVFYVRGDTVTIIDHKTGKIKDEHEEQLDLYALGMFKYFPHAKKVQAELWYIDQEEIHEKKYTRKDIPRLEKHFAKETKALLSDTTWKEKPSALCKYCFFSKGKNGNCKF